MNEDSLAYDIIYSPLNKKISSEMNRINRKR